MKEDQEQSGGALVSSSSRGLTRKSSGLLRRGLDDLLKEQAGTGSSSKNPQMKEKETAKGLDDDDFMLAVKATYLADAQWSRGGLTKAEGLNWLHELVKRLADKNGEETPKEILGKYRRLGGMLMERFRTKDISSIQEIPAFSDWGRQNMISLAESYLNGGEAALERTSQILFHDERVASKPKQSIIIFDEDTGHSEDTAIVIRGAESNRDYVTAEYWYLQHKFGRCYEDWRPVPGSQFPFTDEVKGREYDLLRIRFSNGAEREIYFDITDFHVAPKSRIVRFPRDHSMGNLYVRDCSQAGEIGWQVRSTKLGEAQGTVEVPNGKDLSLIISEEGLRDLSPLLTLKPDDLQAITFPLVSIGAERLNFLQGLGGLVSLKLRLSSVHNSELDCLKNLRALRSLYLLGDDVTEAELDKLRRHLPNCAVLSESSTDGLVNKDSAYTAKQMMEALNDEGYRDENGQPFTNVDDFLRAVELDAAGVKKLYSIKRQQIEDDE